jgi:hypothetical protein
MSSLSVRNKTDDCKGNSGKMPEIFLAGFGSSFYREFTLENGRICGLFETLRAFAVGVAGGSVGRCKTQRRLKFSHCI